MVGIIDIINVGLFAAALREASLLARERDAHPYFWAPCLLVGNPGRPGDGGLALEGDQDYI